MRLLFLNNVLFLIGLYNMMVFNFVIGGGFIVRREEEQELCSWCEQGTCDDQCDRTLNVMKTSISEQIGNRGFPYYSHKNLSLDKKNSNKMLKFILINDIGDLRLLAESQDNLQEFLEK